MRRIASYLTNKSGFSDQFTAAAVGQTILGQPPGTMKMMLTGIAVALISSVVFADTPIGEDSTSKSTKVQFEKIADLPGYPKSLSDGNFVAGFVTSNSIWPDLPDISSKMGYRWHESSGVEWLQTEAAIQSELTSVNDHGDAAGQICEDAYCHIVL